MNFVVASTIIVQLVAAVNVNNFLNVFLSLLKILSVALY